MSALLFPRPAVGLRHDPVARRGGWRRRRATASLPRDNGFAAYEALASCSLAALPGSDVAEAEAALARGASVLADSDVRRCRHALWKATRDPAHRDAARRALLAASECREILDDWRAEFGDDDSHGTESATRVG